jgi:hypothetical protein
MKKFLLLVFMIIVLLSISIPVFAGPGTGDCVQVGQDLIVAVLDSPFDTESGNRGDARADGFFGNEPNLTDTNTNLDLGPNEVDPGSSAGSVVPSQSPGPQDTNGDPTTWGSIIHGSVPASCVD